MKIKNLSIQNKILIFWFIAFVLASISLVKSDFKSESNDSKYYSELVVRYQHAEFSTLLSPKWGDNFWGFDKNSYMRDQFPGQLLIGVGLSKCGIVATQSLHLIGLLFQVLSIILIVQIAAFFITFRSASILYYTLLLVPLSFSYNIRANHELGIMFFCLLSLWSGLKISLSLKKSNFYLIIWMLIASFSCVMLLLIKGPFFLFGLISLLIGGLFSDSKFSALKNIFTFFIALSLVLITAYIYEKTFLKITGESFFEEFYKIQIQKRAISVKSNHSFFIQKIINFYYYFWHYLAYALPWSFLFLLKLLKLDSLGREKLKAFLKSKVSWCFLLSSLSFCVLFSLSDRTAGRYVFPGYYLFSAWICLALYEISDWFQLMHKKLEKIGLHLLTPLLWLLAFYLHFIKFT